MRPSHCEHADGYSRAITILQSTLRALLVEISYNARYRQMQETISRTDMSETRSVNVALSWQVRANKRVRQVTIIHQHNANMHERHATDHNARNRRL